MVVLLSSLALAAEKWANFVCPDGDFSLLMPGRPTANHTTRSSFLGDVTSHTYRSNVDQCTFSVGLTVVPSIATSLGRTEMFGQARGGLLKDAGGVEVSCTKLEHGDYPGRELHYKMAAHDGFPARKGKTWFLLVGRKLIVVDGRVPEDGSKDADLQRMFGSLHID